MKRLAFLFTTMFLLTAQCQPAFGQDTCTSYDAGGATEIYSPGDYAEVTLFHTDGTTSTFTNVSQGDLLTNGTPIETVTKCPSPTPTSTPTPTLTPSPTPTTTPTVTPEPSPTTTATPEVEPTPTPTLPSPTPSPSQSPTPTPSTGPPVIEVDCLAEPDECLIEVTPPEEAPPLTTTPPVTELANTGGVDPFIAIGAMLLIITGAVIMVIAWLASNDEWL